MRRRPVAISWRAVSSASPSRHAHTSYRTPAWHIDSRGHPPSSPTAHKSPSAGLRPQATIFTAAPHKISNRAPTPPSDAL
ncbi:hypothetical protein VTO73DRAFT_10950 [Trametes versicolor]